MELKALLLVSILANGAFATSFIEYNDKCSSSQRCVDKKNCKSSKGGSSGGCQDLFSCGFGELKEDGLLSECECCEKDQIEASCSDFTNGGFRCVSQNQCNTKTEECTDIFSCGFGGLKQDDLQELDEVNVTPSKSKCPLTSQVCCHEDKIKKEKSQKPCSSFRGAKCVERTQCLDEPLKFVTEAGQTSGASSGICPSSSQICCNNVKVPPKSASRCGLLDGDEHKCLPVHLCNTKEVASQGGDPVFDVRNDGLTEINSEVSLCPGDDICCIPGQKTPFVPEPIVPKCGTHNPSISGIKQKKGTAGFGEWPHACLLANKADNSILGGATLIAPGVVVTAAHKLRNRSPDDLIVRCGDWDLNRKTEAREHQDRSIRKIVNHPNFAFGKPTSPNKPTALWYNVGVLFTTREFALDVHVGTMCLPKSNSLGDYDDQDCYVMGWGKKSFGGKDYSDVMKQVTPPLVADGAKCQSDLRANSRLFNFEFHESYVCAGGRAGEDTCKGDGGSALVCKNRARNRFEMVGLTSFSDGCGKRGVPAIYASIPQTVDWIKSVAKREMSKEDYQKYIEE